MDRKHELHIWAKAVVGLFFLASGLGILHGVAVSISDFEQQIFILTNQQRAEYHLPQLEYDIGLAELARQHSYNMQAYGFFDHKDQKGDYVSERHQKNYNQLIVSSIGENLARFFNSEKVFTPQEIVDGWMNSPEHRKNMLDPDYTHLGVGVVISNSTLLATQNFATEIVRMDTPLPNKISRKSNLRLEFTYRSPRPWQTFNSVLVYPDPNVRYNLDNKHYCTGSEPVKITWLDEQRFAVDVRFASGKGTYYLNFGFNGGYYKQGIKLRVR